MNKKRGIIALIVAMTMFCMMSMSALAAVEDLHINLPANQEWVNGGSVSRSGAYSYVRARCKSVYPSSGIDTYTKIQARLVDSSGTLVMNSDYVILDESDGYKSLYIKEGYLTISIVFIQFRGNTNAAAEAIVCFYSN